MDPSARTSDTADRSITIREVGLRDGLQSIARTLPTPLKLEWIDGAHRAGLRELEVGSFVAARLLRAVFEAGVRRFDACLAGIGGCRAGLPKTMVAAA